MSIRYLYFARVDVSDLRTKRVGGDQHALDEHVRIAFHQVAIFERARLGFTALQTTYFTGELRHEAPLHPGRKPARHDRAVPTSSLR